MPQERRPAAGVYQHGAALSPHARGTQLYRVLLTFQASAGRE